MPKIIQNLRENILRTTKEELFKNGYKALNMRTIAKLNNTAVGTIYNYFSSKDMLVASLILNDWQKAISDIQLNITNTNTIDEGLETIIKQIVNFYSEYVEIFKSSGLTDVRVTYASHYEKLIRTIGNEIETLIRKFELPYSEFEISFIVVNIVGCVTNKWPVHQTIQILKRVITRAN